MIKALLYKEWLKLRYAGWLPFMLAAAALADTYLSIRSVHMTGGGAGLWGNILYKNYIPFSIIKYAPLFAGVWFAAFQFVPECMGRRLRLLLHLPISENKAVYLMLATGLCCLAATVALLCGGLAAIMQNYVPWEITRAALLTIAPWCAAGFLGYTATALVAFEPRPLRRVWTGVVLAFLISLYFEGWGYASFSGGLDGFILLSAVTLLPPLAAVQRFKKGITW